MKTFTKIFTILMFIMICVSCKHAKEYQVFAIKYCDEGRMPADGMVIGAAGNDSIDVSDFFWLLKDPDGGNVLVDAGFIDSTHTTKNYIRPDSVLLQLNISPREISEIIITHPHYDHIGGITLFPNARIWMNQADYEYFIGTAWEAGGDSTGFNRQDVINIKSINSQGRLKLVKGDSIEIMPGIDAFTGSRHTFENIYLLVNSNSEKNKVLLASDAIWFYMNLEKELPISLCFDSASYVKAIKRIKTLVPDPNMIIPGHDKNVISKFSRVNDNIVRIEEKNKI